VFGGVLLALVFWWPSLTPTLIPRPWGAQAVISGVCLSIGYGVGAVVYSGVERLLTRWNRFPGPTVRRWSWIVLGALWLIAVLVGSRLWLRWQNDQRDLMGMPLLRWWHAVAALAVSVLVGALLVVVARAIDRGVRGLNGQVRRRLPHGHTAPWVTLLILVIGIGLVGLAGFRGLDAYANSTYGSENDSTDEGVSEPTSSSVSGSSESLVPWQSLGRNGRNFVATATTPAQLEAFHGPAAHPAVPVRVYVGVRSADTLQERAELAVRELERAGGFDRKILVVWIPTGSGWVVSEAAEAVEQLYDGDTAIVTIQYSFLPSLLNVFLKPGIATAAGSALFSAVEKRWLQLPPDHRPKLVLFGKSLGTSGVEAPFAAVDATSSLANLVARTDGALIVGAQHGNAILSQLTRGRDPGSPVWQPVYDAGHTVRFFSRDPNPPTLSSDWPAPRVVYLQHPSDPVPFWGIDAFWRPPEWMDQPRGYDVPGAAHWFPIVSGIQAAGDQFYQLSPPPGFGHDYGTEYVLGWAEVAPPTGWTDSDTQRLEDFLDHGGEGESEE